MDDVTQFIENESMDVWMLKYVWMYECDVWTYGYMDEWMYGCMDVRMHG